MTLITIAFPYWKLLWIILCCFVFSPLLNYRLNSKSFTGKRFSNIKHEWFFVMSYSSFFVENKMLTTTCFILYRYAQAHAQHKILLWFEITSTCVAITYLICLVKTRNILNNFSIKNITSLNSFNEIWTFQKILLTDWTICDARKSLSSTLVDPTFKIL